MQNWVALLRGINVGGNNKLPMADLRAICESLGWQDVQSYIASGNVVFRSDHGAEALAAELHKALPFDVPVLVLSGDDLKHRLSHCPFARNGGKLVHGFFCMDRPTLDEDVIAHYATTEKVVQLDHTVWLNTPDGFSNSKLAEVFHRAVTGTTFTARNINTVAKLVEMLDNM